jgi:hypothetical protein
VRHVRSGWQAARRLQARGAPRVLQAKVSREVNVKARLILNHGADDRTSIAELIAKERSVDEMVAFAGRLIHVQQDGLVDEDKRFERHVPLHFVKEAPNRFRAVQFSEVHDLLTRRGLCLRGQLAAPLDDHDEAGAVVGLRPLARPLVWPAQHRHLK